MRLMDGNEIADDARRVAQKFCEASLLPFSPAASGWV